jgi:hypothetical protein
MKSSRLLTTFFGSVVFDRKRKLMLDSVITTSGAAYYSDLVATRANFHAFR